MKQCFVVYGRGAVGFFFCFVVFQFLLRSKVPGGGGDSKKRKVGVLVVSLRGVNFRFWSRLGC